MKPIWLSIRRASWPTPLLSRNSKMRLVCVSSQLTGAYGTVIAGEEFECEDSIATELLRAGFVRKPGSPTVRYETKVIVPEAPQVSARQPFRHLPVSDPRPETVASEGDYVFPPPADQQQRGAAHPGGRRGRTGPRS